MIVLTVEQGTAEWKEARRGIPTASCFDKIVTPKGEPPKSRTGYMYKLAAERLSGDTEAVYQSAAMERGVSLEGEAADVYEFGNDLKCERVGLVYQDERRLWACSPDRLVGDDGGLEIKCPAASTHVGYLLDGTLPTDYYQQVQGNLAITGRSWWDFMSYYPGLKPLIIRIEPDKAFIQKLLAALEVFNKDLEEVVRRIKA